MPPTSSWLPSVEILVLGAIWGAAFMFMRIAVPHFGPYALVEVRLVLGAFFLLPFLWKDRHLFTASVWWRATLVGSLNAALPMLLFAWAAQRSPAGVGAICNSTTAMFAALVAVFFFGERLQGRRVAGLILGFLGVVVLASGKTGGDRILLPAIVATLGAACYGIGINLARRYLPDLPPYAVACANLVAATALCTPFALGSWPAAPVPTTAWVAAVGLGIICTGVGFVMYYRLLYRIGASRAATVSYLIPLFGVFWGWLLLEEPLTATMAAACALSE
jgi:drug/metabolite transporter (DMT)-like permease